MSDFCRFNDQPTKRRLMDIGLRRLLHHDGNFGFIDSYKRLAKRLIAKGRGRLERESPYLLKVISDDRNLMEAWDYLRRHGGKTPGPDGLTYSDWDGSDLWSDLRDLRDRIRSHSYSPGEEKVVEIRKAGKPGTRPLVLQNIMDRVVQRAASQVLTPWLEYLFVPYSFGFRPRPCGGPFTAIATAQHLANTHDARYWVSVDIKNAFTAVPLSRLFKLLPKYLWDENLSRFLQVILPAKTIGGLRQGAPTSPLFLNLYLHHFVDSRWRKQFVTTPLLRYADDILILCRTLEDAQAAYTSVSKLVADAGMKLKETATEAIVNMDEGLAVRWMGLDWCRNNDRFEVTIADSSWDVLADKIRRCHARPHSPFAALAQLKQWSNHRAPCYPFESFASVHDRMRSVMNSQGFMDVPTLKELEKDWQGMYARYQALRVKAIARWDKLWKRAKLHVKRVRTSFQTDCP